MVRAFGTNFYVALPDLHYNEPHTSRIQLSNLFAVKRMLDWIWVSGSLQYQAKTRIQVNNWEVSEQQLSTLPYLAFGGNA